MRIYIENNDARGRWILLPTTNNLEDLYPIVGPYMLEKINDYFNSRTNRELKCTRLYIHTEAEVVYGNWE